MLARWVNELYSDRRRILASKTNPDAPFEPEVKRLAVMELCTRRVSASEVARRIGVSRAVLYKWKDEIIALRVQLTLFVTKNTESGKTWLIQERKGTAR